MNKNKIFNDPVYGFVSIPYEIIFDLIQHPWVQRLRRISQLGMTHLTYPGATHTRFHHALGALHLMNLSIDVLRQKGAAISGEEAEGASIAILLHDIGHGPFSHALEEKLVAARHEMISIRLLESLNRQFDSRLDLAISIFLDTYPKRFLHQLISGQLDLDRMDYLNRDSFYTGVMEGKIGYDRIIKMLNVVDDKLVVEEKGLASIENFLVARKIMYWQVYLHKTVLAAETMLIAAIQRAKELYLAQNPVVITPPLSVLFEKRWDDPDLQPEILDAFVQVDDVDVMILLKNSLYSDDYLLRTLARGLIQRKLFRVELSNHPQDSSRIEELRQEIAHTFSLDDRQAYTLIFTGREQVEIYSRDQDQILIYGKNGQVRDLNEMADFDFLKQTVIKHYLCYPRLEQ
jgi:uncharacterized protein